MDGYSHQSMSLVRGLEAIDDSPLRPRSTHMGSKENGPTGVHEAPSYNAPN